MAQEASELTGAEAVNWPSFDDWWDAYDYKLDRRRCERLWKKMSALDRSKAMSHTARYVASTYTDGRFPSRRHPGTYLHNANWNDDALIKPTGPAAMDERYITGSMDALARKLRDRED